MTALKLKLQKSLAPSSLRFWRPPWMTCGSSPRQEMAFGAVHKDDLRCELLDVVGDVVAEATATLSAVMAGNAGGVKAEHLAEVWRMSHKASCQNFLPTIEC